MMTREMSHRDRMELIAYFQGKMSAFGRTREEVRKELKRHRRSEAELDKVIARLEETIAELRTELVECSKGAEQARVAGDGTFQATVEGADRRGVSAGH